MRTDDGRIDHLQRGVRHSASREPFQDHVPDATVGPPPKLPKDRIPVAEALRQVAPWCAGSHQPKHRVEHAAMIAWRPAAAAMDQERFEVRPLIVGHQSANQGCPPQRAALNQFAILASIGLSTRPSATSLSLSRQPRHPRGREKRSPKRTPSDGCRADFLGSWGLLFHQYYTLSHLILLGVNSSPFPQRRQNRSDTAGGGGGLIATPGIETTSSSWRVTAPEDAFCTTPRSRPSPDGRPRRHRPRSVRTLQDHELLGLTGAPQPL